MILEKYEYNITKASDKEFILSVNGINYLVGEIIYLILQGTKEGKGLNTIVETIKGTNDYKDVNKEEVNGLITNQIIPLLEDKNVIKKKNPVKSLFILLRPEKYIHVFKWFNIVFTPVFFWISFSILSLFSCYFFITDNTSFDALFQLKFSWVWTFLFTYLVIVIHEIGHVVAATKFKIVAKEIGFGFYFIYPALYTDLSEIWKLNKKDRIIVNLGGMYFQMFINVVLAILILVYPAHKTLFISFFLSNMALIFFNFNPLFKFDAYWIFSDFFEIHNLREQSNKVLLSFIKKADFPKIEPKKKIPLVIYSISFFFFMALVWFLITKYFIVSSIELYHIYQKDQFSSITEIDTFKKIFGFGFTLFLVIRILISVFQLKKYLSPPKNEVL